MAKVSIYTTQYNRPELLILQYEKLKKYCKDDFEYKVINNGIDLDISLQISNACENYKVTEISISKNERVKMTAMHHKEALQFAYDNYVSKDLSEIRVVMDSDIIPFDYFSFSDILGDYDIAGIRQGLPPALYLASFISIYSKNVQFIDFDLGAHIEFDPYLCTKKLVKKYKTKWIDHTAPVKKIESEYIFKNCTYQALIYEEHFQIQFIESCLIHYYRGSGWDNGDPEYYERKSKFINSFLENQEFYNVKLDKNVQYESAHMDEWLNKDNYNLHKYEKLSSSTN
jgi:hypothetical protein